MRITWHGHSSFRLQWEGVTVLTDPFDETVGYRLPREQVDIVTVSHEHFDHNYTAGLVGQPTVIRGTQVSVPEVAQAAGLGITGLPSFHDSEGGSKRGLNTIYRFDHPELRLAHLGDLGHTPSSEALEQLYGLDLLLVPVGGTFTLDGAAAAQLVRKLAPRVVIPMHYQTDALRFTLAEVSEFTRHFSTVSHRKAAAVDLAADMLPEHGLSVLVLDY